MANLLPILHHITKVRLPMLEAKKKKKKEQVQNEYFNVQKSMILHVYAFSNAINQDSYNNLELQGYFEFLK